jgi:glycyl-tRNA synthetase beta chain
VADLLLEIGCEEIPARVLSTVLADLPRLAEEDLRSANVKHGAVSALGAPRRIALLVRDVLDRQPDVDETIVGPVVSAGDKARTGFARKVGVPPELVVVENERFVARRKVVGRPALELLPDLLTRLIGRLPFPKSMRWGQHSARFVRPVRWLLALFGGEVVPIELAGVRSGRQSRGHRFLAPEAFVVDSAESWQKGLAQRSVVVDPDERRKQVVAELDRIARETGLTVQRDDALVEEVTNLVELPVGVCGSFDPQFLELPEVVVVSAMRRHQRYFAVRQPDGKLSNQFVTIAGTRVRDVGVVVRGNERVLRARLADARFFLEEDRKLPLEKHAEKLSRVVWIQKLGTMSERVGRLEKLARALGAELGLDQGQISRAARLAKADLTTHMVGEFPDLQGFVGADYAQREKEPAEVSRAIVEHYQPRTAGESPAASPLGAALAVADRVDALVGCFSAGLAPTGSNDPFALRRAAFGLLQTVLAHRWHLSLRKLAEGAAAGYGTAEAPPAVPAVLEFVLGRLRGLLGEKFPGDLVEAVLAAGYDDPQDAQLRLQALSDFRSTADFESLSVAIKRAGNIVKGGLTDLEIDPATLGEPAERTLHARIGEVRGRLDPRLAARDYRAVLDELAQLRGPIDAFFESIFVMDEDLTVRNRRLALLTQVHRLFLRVADFRQIGGS